MENRAYTLIAGLFALLLGIGLLVSFWWLNNSHTPQRSYQMKSLSPVSGLNKRAAVHFRGVSVGHVESISMDPTNPIAIIVTISVDENLILTKGSFGHLAGQGLTGLSYIELDDSGIDRAPLGDQMMTLNESQMSGMLASGKKVVANVEEIAINANKLITNLNMVLDDKGRQRVSRLLENLDHAGTELQPMLKASTAAMHEISKVGATLNEETLPRFHQLTHQLNQDAVTLNRLLNTLDEHPESVLFGKPPARPGPAEKGHKP